MTFISSRSLGIQIVASLALALVLMVGTPVFARSIPGAANEVLDPWFIDYVDSQATTWYESNNGSGGFTSNNPGELPGYYYDPGRNPGDQGFLRTIVDDYDGLWDPAFDNKEIDLFFYAHLAGDGYIDVTFDWWDDESIDRPSPDPSALPQPDGYSVTYRLTASDPGPFRVANDLVQPPEIPGFFVPYDFTDTWDHQPRWVSIEFELGNLQGGIGGEALLTGIDFEAQCVPEPGTLLMFGLGVAGLAAARRRRSLH